MVELETDKIRIARVRRNFLKIGAVGAAALLASLVKPPPAMALSASCFLRGTRIRTASGYRNVEELVPGDFLPTAFAGLQPIQWILNYTHRRGASEPWPEHALPVRMAPSAFGPNNPARELYITRGHAVLIDGVLTPVASLINGSTVAPIAADEVGELEYFHIKLARHDVVYAEGAPCETLREVRDDMPGYDDYVRQFGVPLSEPACIPIMAFDGARSELKSRLRSAISPWLDRRQPLDLVRDRLEERADVLSRQPELAP
jgi:hypothetical protein